MSSKPRPVLAIAEHFSKLEDARVQGRTEHSLLSIVVIALVGVISGADGWDEIHDIALDRRRWLKRHIALPNGMPSADTIRRVIGRLQPEAFMACVTSWVATLTKPLNGQVVAVDGKTIRGAKKRSSWSRMLHQVHVWSCSQRLLLAQASVAGAPQESAAVRRMLELLVLEGAVVTADAAHCCKATAQSILDAGADYILALKGNRGPLFERVTRFFETTELKPGVATHHRSECIAHGRQEIREAWSVDAKLIGVDDVEWPSLKSVTLIKRTRETPAETTVDSHYFVSSLPPRVRKLESGVREHWGIENNLHWPLDVQMDEDASTIRDEVAAVNFGGLRRIALTLLTKDTTVKRGIAAKRAKAARNPQYLDHVLSLGIP